MHKVGIIGGGPAGIAAAIQLRRYRIPSLLFEKNKLGGLARNAYRIENYPGFPDGVSGRRFVELLRKQAAGCNIRYEEVKFLDYRKEKFIIKTSKSEYTTEYAIIASGTKPRKLNTVEKLPNALKERISYEVYPLLGIKRKLVAIVGAGDAAFDYALNLSERNRVTILNRGNRIRALPLLVERVKNNKNIEYFDGIAIEGIERGKEHPLLLRGAKMEVDYLVIAIGRIPQKDFYSPNLKSKENQLINKGVLYLVGDVKNDRCRQISISVGDGVSAAMKIHLVEK